MSMTLWLLLSICRSWGSWGLPLLSYFSYLTCEDCVNLWVMKDYGVVESWAEMLVIEHHMPFWEPWDSKVIKFFENRNILFLVY